jgi:hypothetical protein
MESSHSKMMKERWKDPKYRAKISAAMTRINIERWEDPEYDRNLRASFSRVMIKYYKDPKNRQKTSEAMKNYYMRKKAEALLICVENSIPRNAKGRKAIIKHVRMIRANLD